MDEVMSSYDILSYRFRIRCDEEIGARVHRLLEPFRVSRPDDQPIDTYTIRHDVQRDPSFQVFLERGLLQQAASLAGVLDYIIWKVNEEAIARTDRFLALHAAAASWDNEGIVISGASGSGKTTLVAGLVRGGLEYLTDETALIEPTTGEVHPHPRALWMAPGSIDALPGLRELLTIEGDRRKYPVPPADLRARAIGLPCPVRTIMFPRYVKGSPVVLTPVSRGRALFKLANQCFNLARFEVAGLLALRRVVAGAECYELQMGELDEAVARVLELMQEPARQTG